MDYKRPEDIDVFFINQYEYPEETREMINANFRDIAFCMFTLLDNDYRKIGDYTIKIEDQINYMNENIKLYYMKKCVFELRGCNNGAWMVLAHCSPETTDMFCYLVDQKFNVANCIDNTAVECNNTAVKNNDSMSVSNDSQSGFDRTKDAFGRPLKESYPGLFWENMSAKEEEEACDKYWEMVSHVDKDIFHKE